MDIQYIEPLYIVVRVDCSRYETLLQGRIVDYFLTSDHYLVISPKLLYKFLYTSMFIQPHEVALYEEFRQLLLSKFKPLDTPF